MRKILSVIVAGILLCAGSVLAGEDGPLIVFDQGHDQRFLIEEKGELQLSKLAEIVGGQGGHVTATRKPLTEDALKGVSALVISGPFKALQAEEVEVVAKFVERGGRLALMLHIGPPLAELLTRLDLDHSNAVIHERNNVIDADINFHVATLAASPLFAGLTQFSVYGVWALDPGKTALPLAKTSEQAWADLDGDKVLSRGDIVGEFTVAVSGTFGSGSFVVFGDDAMFQNRYLDEDNSKLAANLGGWLAGR
jgi:hypothetical protein